jgi:hypothetical protein
MYTRLRQSTDSDVVSSEDEDEEKGKENEE